MRRRHLTPLLLLPLLWIGTACSSSSPESDAAPEERAAAQAREDLESLGYL